MTRLAIFDCDGTLVDSGGTIFHALRATFAEAGMALPPPSVTRRVIGLSLHEAMAGLVPGASAAEHRQLAERYKQQFTAMRAAGQVEEPLYPGIIDLLDALEEDGWQLAVATGKSDRGLKHCLQRHDIHARFVSLQTADRHPSKPHPSMVEEALAEAGADPAQSLMIGDTSYDMEMGAAAGVIPVGVAWGYHHQDDLHAAGAVFVAEAPDEILSFTRGQARG